MRPVSRDETIAALNNWAAWQRSIQDPRDGQKVKPQPWAKNINSGGIRGVEYCNVDAAIALEAIINDVLPSIHRNAPQATSAGAAAWIELNMTRKVLKMYFLTNKSKEDCWKKLGMGERLFNQFLNNAIGRISRGMEEYL